MSRIRRCSSAKDGGGRHRVLLAQHFRHRIGATSKETDAADGHGHFAFVHIVAADSHIAVLQGVLQLHQGHAPSPQAIRIGPNLVTADSAPEAPHVDNPLNGAKFSLRTQSCWAFMSLSV